MSKRIPAQLLAGIAVVIATAGGAGIAHKHTKDTESLAKNDYIQAVVADTTTSQAVKIAMVMGSFYESSYKHIGTPYIDRLGKGQPLTVCNGITGPSVVAGKYYTPAECYALERELYRGYDLYLNRDIAGFDRLTPLQQASFMDFVHNVGSAGFSDSTMRRKLLAGDVVGACRENRRWVYGTINGAKVALPGLVIRRNANSDLCDGTERIEGMVFDG